MPLVQLLSWYNLLFVVPFVAALLYLVVYTFSGVTFGEVDLDADADLHLDVDADADADGHVEADADHDASAEQGTGGYGFSDILALLGVGRVPVSLIVMILLLFWGVVGFIANELLLALLHLPWLVVLISLPLTAVVSLTCTGCIARTVGRFMPTTETSAQRKSALVGRKGEALFAIDATFGLAAVRDRQGDLFQVPCRVPADKQAINKGSRVVLYDYDDAKGVFYVAPLEL